MLVYVILASMIIGYNQEPVNGKGCGYPGKPRNGTYQPGVKLFYPGDEVEYSCSSPFILKGLSRRVCTDSGKWSGQLPVCKENIALQKPATQSDVLWNYSPDLALDGDLNSCSFTSRKDGPRWWQVSLNDHKKIESVWVTMSPGSYQKFAIFVVEILDGSTAEYKPCAQWEGRLKEQRKEFLCSNGGQRGQFLYIRDDRMDSEYFGLCEVEIFAIEDNPECGSPELPLHTEMLSLSSKQAEYKCAPGFTTSTLVTPTINCTKDGWTGHVPTCTEVSCDHPTSAKDGFIEVSNFRGNYVYGSRAKYHCNPGYILWGNSTRVCDASGTWTGTTPMCRPISCGEPPMLPSSAVALINGSSQWKSVAVYSCLPGYTMDNMPATVKQSVCQESGTWSPVTISCRPSQHINKPINTVWVKDRETGSEETSTLTIVLLSVLGAGITFISIFALISILKKWMVNINYVNHENIFVEKPLLESHENHALAGLETSFHGSNGHARYTVSSNRYTAAPSKFQNNLSTSTSDQDGSSETSQLTSFSTGTLRADKNCATETCNSIDSTLCHIPTQMPLSSLRFKYADVEELMKKSSDFSNIEEKNQYANVTPKHVHYATLARDNRFVPVQTSGDFTHPLHFATLSKRSRDESCGKGGCLSPSSISAPMLFDKAVQHSESVPDILQTVTGHPSTLQPIYSPPQPHPPPTTLQFSSQTLPFDCISRPSNSGPVDTVGYCNLLEAGIIPAESAHGSRTYGESAQQSLEGLTLGDNITEHNGEKDNTSIDINNDLTAKPSIAAKPNIIVNSGYIFNKHEESLIDLGTPDNNQSDDK